MGDHRIPKRIASRELENAGQRSSGGRRGGGKLGSEECKVLGERLLSFSANHELALLNTFFSTAKNAISHTFNGRGKKRIDYILTRQ